LQHRGHIPQKERHARSKLAKLLHGYPFVKGVLVISGRTCGKPQCKCSRGEKHLSCYLSIRHEGKRKMICVPKQWEGRIRTSVKTYKDVMELMDIVSDSCVDRLIKSKKTKRLD
jgi:hypothetical protein